VRCFLSGESKGKTIAVQAKEVCVTISRRFDAGQELMRGMGATVIAFVANLFELQLIQHARLVILVSFSPLFEQLHVSGFCS
jgi:hypothetical protein